MQVLIIAQTTNPCSTSQLNAHKMRNLGLASLLLITAENIPSTTTHVKTCALYLWILVNCLYLQRGDMSPWGLTFFLLYRRKYTHVNCCVYIVYKIWNSAIYFYYYLDTLVYCVRLKLWFYHTDHPSKIRLKWPKCPVAESTV